MKGWTAEHIAKLETRGMIIDYTKQPNNRNIVINPVNNIAKNIPARSIPREEPRPLTEMKRILKFMQVVFVTEYQFSKPRKYRFDIAIPEKKIACEYEGLFSNRSRHTMNYQSFLHDIGQLL
ncbi:MAG TPA: hypothetical protein VMY77_14475 [Chitinophagaceae bacterium]|nr:hypothetical protein [Chitinophagaceae bacterium]